MLIFINEQCRFTNSPAVATNSRWCQQQSPTASLAAVTGPKAKWQKMQKKKESKTSRQKHKSETEVACASSSSLALSLCHCVQWHCSLLLYSWCGWIRFDFYLTETDSLWLSLCLVVCAKMTVNMPGQGHFLPLCPHSLQTFANENFSFMTGCIMLTRSPYSFIHSFTYSCVRSFKHIRICRGR